MINEGDAGSVRSALARQCSFLLVKLASRCNIACTYCYWFRDEGVLARPPTLTDHAATALIYRIREHIEATKLDQFAVALHGGEPLLYPRKKLFKLIDQIRDLNLSIKLNLTTNGLLLDKELARFFETRGVGVTVSLDGPADDHNARRPDFHGKGTHSGAVRAIRILQDRGLAPGLLAVCRPNANVKNFLAHVVDELQVLHFDVLVPDATANDRVESIAPFYCELFDLWYSHYASKGVQIRWLDSVVRGLFGLQSRTESIGSKATTTATVHTDGALGAHDVGNVTRGKLTPGGINIVTHPIADICADPTWQEIYFESQRLPNACRGCELSKVCGAGHIMSRWSDQKRFDNRSIYCSDFKTIIPHIWSVVRKDVVVERPRELSDAVYE